MLRKECLWSMHRPVATLLVGHSAHDGGGHVVHEDEEIIWRDDVIARRVVGRKVRDVAGQQVRRRALSGSGMDMRIPLIATGVGAVDHEVVDATVFETAGDVFADDGDFAPFPLRMSLPQVMDRLRHDILGPEHAIWRGWGLNSQQCQPITQGA